MKKRKIPKGFYTKKHLFLFWFTVFIFGVITILLENFSYSIFNVEFSRYFLIYLIIILLSLIFICILIDPLIKIINKMNLKANYDEFVKGIDNILANNLHDEYRNYVNSVKVNYMYAKNLDEALKLFETLEKPLSKGLLAQYYIVKTLYYINTYNEELADATIHEMEAIRFNKKHINELKRIRKIFLSTDGIEEIEKIYRVNTPFMFVNLSNANTLMVYFNKRGNLEKAKEYAQFIVNSDTDLNEFINAAKSILEIN